MLHVGTLRFARTSKEAVSTLFDGPASFAGYYTRRNRGIVFMDMQRQPFVFLCAHDPRQPFFVSCRKHAALGGRIWYTQALMTVDHARLALPDGYCAELDVARAVWEQAGAQTTMPTLDGTLAAR